MLKVALTACAKLLLSSTLSPDQLQWNLAFAALTFFPARFVQLRGSHLEVESSVTALEQAVARSPGTIAILQSRKS